MGNNKINDDKKWLKCWWFWLPWRCGDMMRGASTNESHTGLHSKPLDAAIGWVPMFYCRGCRDGHRFEWNTQNTNRTQLLASKYGKNRSLVVYENFIPRMDPLLSSSMQQASFECEMPWLELKSSWIFLAIKRCQQTKVEKLLSDNKAH